MKWAGIILSDNIPLGEAVKTDLGLTSWLVTSGDRVAAGGCRGTRSAPRLLVLSGAPYAVRDELAAIFGTETPAVYWLTGSAL